MLILSWLKNKPKKQFKECSSSFHINCDCSKVPCKPPASSKNKNDKTNADSKQTSDVKAVSIYSGFLLKQGQINKAFKRRYFVLNESSLSYSTDQNGVCHKCHTLLFVSCEVDDIFLFFTHFLIFVTNNDIF